MAERPILDFRLIAEPLDQLLTAFENTTERELPEKWHGMLGAGLLVQGSVRVAATTYQLTRFICKDRNRYRDPWQNPEFVTAVPPLTRSILDILFALVFLFDDVAVKSELFIMGGWREMCEESERMQREYDSNPKWVKYLNERAVSMENMRSARDLPRCGDTRRLNYWPTPSQMRNDASLSGDRKHFLDYLNDWYYRELSSADHLSFPGLIVRGTPLMKRGTDESVAKLNLLRSYWLEMTVILIMAILSEIQMEAAFSFSDRLKYIWRILIDSDNPREIYDLRYKDTL